MNKILFITDTSPYPTSAGNKKRIHDLLDELIDMGNEVDILYYNRKSNNADEAAEFEKYYSGKVHIFNEKSNILNRIQYIVRKIFYKTFNLVINYNIDDWYNSKIGVMAEELNKKRNYDIIWVEYIMLSRVLNVFDSSLLKVIDTHDSFSNRGEIFKQRKLPLEFFYCSEKSEKKALERADVVVSVSEKESTYFRSIIDDKTKVITIGNFMPIKPPRISNNHNILFVGSNNRMNITGINRFIEQMLPAIKEKVNDCKLYICGSVCESLPSSKEYIKMGFVEDIDEAYEIARIVICPTVGGTGQHVKCLEALYHSKAVVTTEESAKGINYRDSSPFIEADLGMDFSNAVIKFLIDDSFCMNYQNKAHEFALENESKSKEALKSIMETSYEKSSIN